MVAVTPFVRLVARAVGAVKVPGERHIHTRPTPELGGLAFVAALAVAYAVAQRLGAFNELFTRTSEPEAILLAALVIAYVGVIDDTRGLSPLAKLAGQIMAAGTLVLFGVTVRFIYIPFGQAQLFVLSPDAAALLTIVAVVAMINAVNFIDGLDGLAAGIVAIGAAALFLYVQFAPPGQIPTQFEVSAAGLILASIFGACLGFLFYNFNPASIFMGDTGAMLLGLLLAAAGISAIGNSTYPTRADFVVASVPALIPALVIAIPFADTALAIVRRLGSGQPVSLGDKKHLHHRLLEIGHSTRRAVLIMYYWSALLAFGVVGWALLPDRVVLYVLGSGVVLALLFTLVGRGRKAPPKEVDVTAFDPEGKIVYSFTSAKESREKKRKG